MLLVFQLDKYHLAFKLSLEKLSRLIGNQCADFALKSLFLCCNFKDISSTGWAVPETQKCHQFLHMDFNKETVVLCHFFFCSVLPHA